MEKIICIGRNYAKTTAEQSKPINYENFPLFIKPPSNICYIQQDQSIEMPCPKDTSGPIELLHDCELVFEINAQCSDFSRYTIGLDMAKRNLMYEVREKGLPWELAKVFYGSAILGPWLDIQGPEHFKFIMREPFALHVNKETRQSSTGNNMLLKPHDILRWSKEFFEVQPGDIIMTGTPPGAGPVRAGDNAVVQFSNQLEYSIKWT